MKTPYAARSIHAGHLLVALALTFFVGACVSVGPPAGATPTPSAPPTDQPPPTADITPSPPPVEPTAEPSPSAAPTPPPTDTPTAPPTATAEPATPPAAPGLRPHRKSIGDLTYDLGRRSTPCGSTYRTQDQCFIGLRWADVSTNEDGFRVYVAPAQRVRIECDRGGFPCWVASVKCEFGGRVVADLPAGTDDTEIGLLPTDFGPTSAFDSVAGSCIFLVAYNAAGESTPVQEGFAWGRYG